MWEGEGTRGVSKTSWRASRAMRGYEGRWTSKGGGRKEGGGCELDGRMSPASVISPESGSL